MTSRSSIGSGRLNGLAVSSDWIEDESRVTQSFGRTAVILAIPRAVPLSMWFTFSGLRRAMSDRIAYSTGFVLYWAFWCDGVPLLLVGPKGIREMFRRASPTGRRGAVILAMLVPPHARAERTTDRGANGPTARPPTRAPWNETSERSRTCGPRVSTRRSSPHGNASERFPRGRFVPDAQRWSTHLPAKVNRS